MMETIYRTAAKPWDLSGNVGNHRLVVKVSEPGEYVRIRVDWLGRPFAKTLCCPKGKIQPLWFGLMLPADRTGELSFEIALSAAGHTDSVSIRIRSEGEPIPNHGDGELWRLSRLRWFNSAVGMDDKTVEPYAPVRREGKTLSCLGRSVTLAENGLPAKIVSYFDQSIHVGEKALPILRGPVEFTVRTPDGKVNFSGFSEAAVREETGICRLETVGSGKGLSLRVQNSLEYDGHMETFLTLTAERDTTLSDVSLELALAPECSRYMMGMGREGGDSPKSWEYRWDESRANNFVWIGGVNGGLHIKLRHTQEVWEIYNYQKTGLPESWANQGKGGCRITFGENGADLLAYSGSRSLKAGESVTFRYSLQITPLKELDSDAHWRDRYDHPGDKGIDLDAAKAGGATVVNLHQGRKENPYINYPFCFDELLKPEIRRAHEMGIKYKLYYTVRELTTHALEFFAVRSLGDEILLDGPGFRIAEHFKEGFFAQEKAAKSTGGPWLCEHLPEGFSPAWHTILPDGDYDCSVATVGLSRWHNYYLEGLSWMVRETGADGIYLDGVGYDRQIMKRVRKVLNRSKEGCLIDFHSGNNFHPDYGLCNVLGQYMELLPGVDSLWIGEGFDYEGTSPDYWLVEISGIPFGLMGDMLHRGGNKWRGMAFGMTPRCNWPEGGSPLPVWQLWDSFGMKGCTIRGWWDTECPVKPSHPGCKATAYVQEDRMLVAVASWAEETAAVHLEFRLPEGWDPGKVRYTVPFIQDFQEEEPFHPEDSLKIDPARGRIIKEGQRVPAGHFFYGQRHAVPQMPEIAAAVQNRRAFCIPEAEVVLDEPEKREQFAVYWLGELMKTAKEAGMRVTFSVECQELTPLEAEKEMVKGALGLYPEIDVIELITPEGGGDDSRRISGEEALALSERLFGGEVTDAALAALSRDGNLPYGGTPTYALDGTLRSVKQIWRMWESRSEWMDGFPGKEIQVGLYVTCKETLRVAKEVMNRIFPAELHYSFLPAHGALAVAEAIRHMGFTDAELQKTMLYSWAEFDGNMYIQQNSCGGIQKLLELCRETSPGASIHGICFNHWRTAENSLTLSYAAQASRSLLPASEFYPQYAASHGIGNPETFAGLMTDLENLDIYNRDNLFNVGFCYLGCWLNPKGLGWIRSWKKESLEHSVSAYEKLAKEARACLAKTESPEGLRRLRLLKNRCRCSAEHLRAILELEGIARFADDAHPEKLSSGEREQVRLRCAKALEYCKGYERLHLEEMPDRGCEGTVVSYCATIPAYIDHVLQYFAEGEKERRHQPASLDAPPPPDTAFFH